MSTLQQLQQAGLSNMLQKLCVALPGYCMMCRTIGPTKQDHEVLFRPRQPSVAEHKAWTSLTGARAPSGQHLSSLLQLWQADHVDNKGKLRATGAMAM